MKGSKEMGLHDHIGKQVIVNLIDTAKNIETVKGYSVKTIS